MKVMVRKEEAGHYSVYVAKKDLETNVSKTDPAHAFGGLWELENGDKIYIDPLEEEPKLPKTLNARKISN